MKITQLNYGSQNIKRGVNKIGYLESIFERIETEISSPTASNIQDWLSGQGTKHQKKRSGYRNISIQLAEPFAIREELETTDDFDALRTLRNQARAIPVSNARRDLVSDIEAKMEVVAKELARITEERVEIRLEEKQLERTRIRLEKQLDKIEDNISSSTLGELNRIESKLSDIEDFEIETSTARGLIGDRISEIEEEKALRVVQQIAAKERKIALREQGFEDF